MDNSHFHSLRIDRSEMAAAIKAWNEGRRLTYRQEELIDIALSFFMARTFEPESVASTASANTPHPIVSRELSLA